MDAETDLFKEAVKARWPASAPEDALIHIGTDHNEEKAPRQTVAAFRTMLGQTWSRAEFYGTADGVLDAITPMGFDAANTWVVDVRQGLGWGGSENWPSYFAIIAGVGHDFERTETWADWAGAGLTWDSISEMWDVNITRKEIALLKRLVMRWKDARSFPLELCIVNSGEAWDGLLGAGTTWTALNGASTTWNALAGTAVHIQLGRTWDWWDHYGFTVPTWDQMNERGQTWNGLAVTE